MGLMMADKLYWVRTKRLRVTRAMAGLTQEGLADEVGLSEAQISRIERGHHVPHLRNIDRIAAVLGVDRDYLVQYVDPDEVGEGESPQYPGGARSEQDFDEFLDYEQDRETKDEDDAASSDEGDDEESGVR